MSGRVEAIWTKRAHGSVMDPADAVTMVAGKGIENDVSFGRRKRQVTVIEREGFDRIRKELPEAEPSMRRANVMVSGVPLQDSRNHILTLGDVRIHLHGKTRPCELMDSQVEGLSAALDAEDWGGGAFGVVLDDGEIRVGDVATLEAPSPM